MTTAVAEPLPSEPPGSAQVHRPKQMQGALVEAGSNQLNAKSPMKNPQRKPGPLTHHIAIAIMIAAGTDRRASAANVTWSGAGPDQNWSDAANWLGGTPLSTNVVIFPAGPFPASTNTPGAINNIVDTSVTIAGLTYANTNGLFDTTLIGPNVTLTVNGTVSVGVNNLTTVAGMAGTNCAFLVTNVGGNFNVEGNSATAQTATFTLADATNVIEVGTLSIGQTGGNNGRPAVLNLGNSTNIVYANNLSLGTGKGQGTVQFAGPSGGLTIRSTNGTGRATLLLGNGTSGSGSANGQLLMAGHPANVLAGTVTLGLLGNDSGNQQGGVTIDNGIFDATSILMAVIPSSGSLSTGKANGSSLAVGGDPNNTATLIVNSPSGPGGGSFVLSDNANTNVSHTASATLSINTNGLAQVYSSIVKAQALDNTATININGGKLTLEAATNVVGTPSAPIDMVNLTSATFTLAVANDSTNIVASALSILDAGSTVNVTGLPVLTGYPRQFPIVGYTSLPSGGTLNLGTLPGIFQGYTSNDNVSTIWLVVTNGPVTAKADEWGGGVNNQWDTTSLNWTNAGVAVKYAENDSVTFDDFGQTGTVNLTSPHTPLGVIVTNNTLNYSFTGVGSIGGATGLEKDGSASLSLSETGGDNFSGNIVVNGGTLVLDEPSSAISGALIINGGTVQIGNGDTNGALPSGSISDNGTLAFERTNNVLVATAISGTGSLSQIGSGTVTLSGGNGYTGNTTVSGGTLALTGAGTIASSAAVAVSSAMLDVSGVGGTTALNSVGLTNAALNVSVPYAQAPINVTALSAGGSTNIVNIASLPPIASYPTTVKLIQSASPISGFNFGLGNLPVAAPPYAGNITESADTTAVLLTLTGGPTGVRPFVSWSGVDALSSVNTNWSDGLNWESPGVPGGVDAVVFAVTAAQTASALSTPGGGSAALNPANVNNIVNANFTISSLTYSNANGTYHNTLIQNGATLNITNSGGLTVGSGSADFGAGATEFVTIAGTNGTLEVANTNATLFVGLGDSGSATETATLDMSALGAFNASVSRFLIGVGSSSEGLALGRESGIVYLAATNTIKASLAVSGTETSDTSASAVALCVGDDDGNGGLPSALYLGQTNGIFADAIVTARQKESGGMFFNSAFPNSSAYFRGQDGVSAVATWGIGDGVANSGTVNPKGTNDFTGGNVNALVTTMYVGRAANSSSGTGTANGTLTFDDGVLGIATLYVGYEPANGSKIGVGTVNVNSNATLGTSATLWVSGNLNLALASGGAGAATTAGTLNVSNATAQINGLTAGTNGAISTINLSGATLSISNTAGSPSAPLTSLNLAGGTLELNVGGFSIVSNIVATAVTTNGTTTIQIGLLAGVTTGITYPLISYTGTDPFGSLSLAPLPAGYAGSLVDDTASGIVGLTLTSAPPEQKPVITSIKLQAGNAILGGSNGIPGNYSVLTSTNVALPLANWTRLAPNVFLNNGNFSITNAVNTGAPQQFYILEYDFSF